MDLSYRIPIKYKNIWHKAFQYQDFRNDKGHAFIVTVYANYICELENSNKDIVIPAAILHDIGWSQLSEQDRMSVFRRGVVKEERLRIRISHQEESVKLAKLILSELKYPHELITKILEIISEHDTRFGFLNHNEGVMRDADKLWRFDDYGFFNDNMNSGISFSLELASLEKKLDDNNFFYYDSSRKFATQRIERLKEKYLN